jgi:uncharacterized membrane protein
MWSNLNLLFWLSLIPFTTGWLGENHGGSLPTVLYAAVLLMCGFAYSMLQAQVIKHAQNRDELIKELRANPKGLISLVCYALAVAAGFYMPIISDVLIILISILWFIPDRRIERSL